MESPLIDKLFRRAKDMILIVTSVAAFFGVGLKYYGLPDAVNKHATDIARLDSVDAAQALRIQAVEINAANHQRTLDEVKQYQLETLRRLKR